MSVRQRNHVGNLVVFCRSPRGAIAVAAALKHAKPDQDERVGVVVTGSNVDFRTLPRVVRKSSTSRIRQRYFCFEIEEQNGALIRLLDQFMGDLNIVDFQYGKTDLKVAKPILGIEGPVGSVARTR